MVKTDPVPLAVTKHILLGVAALGGLYITSLSDYLLFHSLAELFSIIIAASSFVIVWNSRHLWINNYLLFVGIAFAFVAGIDLLHTLTYRGMGVFPGQDSNLPTQLWLAARFVQSFALLAAPLLLRHPGRLPANRVLFGMAAAVGVLLASIAVWRVFPVAYIEDQGLTPFKIASEYAVSLSMLAAIALLYVNRSAFSPKVLSILTWSLVFAIASELMFTLYHGVYDWQNLVGHLLKIVSFYLIYVAIIQTGLVHPYDLLFRDLKRAHSELELRVEERTAQLLQREAALSDANAELQEQARRLEASSAHLRELSRRLVQVQEEERRAIARELHDETGQALTSLLLDLGVLERECSASPEAVERVVKLKQMTDGVMEGLHRLAANLRPVSLDRLGLVPALRQYLDSFRRQTGLQVDMETICVPDGARLPPDIETALYRVAQESLTNIVRHAEAKRVGIILDCRDGKAELIIEDNGKGFDADEALARGRLGLVGMRERVEMLGGTLAIESAPGSGATVFATLPLSEEELPGEPAS